MAENIDDIVFNIVNQEAVDRLIRDGEIELPKKKIAVSKDEQWNNKQMTSKVLRGIQNGDSVQKIAKSMLDTVGNNKFSAIRNARTMMTSAENHGRLDSFKNLASQGVVMKKEWTATPDDRTRPSHIDIDGEEQDIDHVFSNGCMFPGDGKGPAEEVWMCRCAMGSHIIGFKNSNGSVTKIEYGRDKTLHDEQMEKYKERRMKSDDGLKKEARANLKWEDLDFKTILMAKEAAGFVGTNWDFFIAYKNGDIESKILDDEIFKSNVSTESSLSVGIDGKDISKTWQRRSDEFNFAIDDVLNAQGFDGLPRVVSPEEFDRYAQESNFVMQRVYAAPNKEVLDAYQDQLYNGKWYVDCSVGGAAHGEGMYTFSANNSTVTDELKKDISSFIDNTEKTGKVTNVETITFTKDAKIITKDDLLAEFEKDVETYAKAHKVDYFDAEDIFAEKFFNRHDEADSIVDLGVYGASKGYDAITVDGTDITVVLNRTKCIFRGE